MRTWIIAVVSSCLLMAGCATGGKAIPVTKAGPMPASRPAKPATTVSAKATSQSQPSSASRPWAAPASAPAGEVATDSTAPKGPSEAATPEPQDEPEASAADAGTASIVAAPLMQVNNHFITMDDIQRAVAQRVGELPKSLPKPAFRKQVEKIIREEARSMVGDLLVEEEAKSRLSDEQNKAIDQEIADTQRDMVVEAGGSKVKLEETLRKQGTSLDSVLADQRRRLVVQVYLRSKFVGSMIITRQALADYYRANAAEFTTPAKVQMQTIACPFRAYLGTGGATATELEKTAAKTKAREAIDEAAAALKAGADFGETARKFSKDAKAEGGGVWPLMSAGSLKETALEQAAFAMKEGQTSEVIETSTGYYIVRTAKLEPGKTVPFEQAQEKIEEKLRQAEYRVKSDEYFSKLLAKATVIQNDKYLDLAVRKISARYGK